MAHQVGLAAVGAGWGVLSSVGFMEVYHAFAVVVSYHISLFSVGFTVVLIGT